MKVALDRAASAEELAAIVAALEAWDRSAGEAPQPERPSRWRFAARQFDSEDGAWHRRPEPRKRF